MFPRHIHQFWNDDSPPARAMDRIRSWRNKNPDFEHTLWSARMAAQFIGRHFGRVAKAHFDNCHTLSARESLLRAAVLLVQGGFYVDVGLECVQSIAPLCGLTGDVLVGVLPDRTTDGTAADRLYWGFMAAQPGARFVGRALSVILAQIAERPNDSSSGTERLDRLYADVPAVEKATIRVLGLRALFEYAEHESGFPPDAADDRAQVSLRTGDLAAEPPSNSNDRHTFGWTRLLFLGHPRCGSSSLAAGLSAAGLDIGHEKQGQDGMVSWWYTGFKVPGAAWPLFVSRGKIWIVGKAFHYLRDPRDAIPSIVLENEANDRANNSFRYRRRLLKRRFDVDIGDLDAPAAAATSYALWNRLAEDIATDGQVLVERPDLARAFPELVLDAFPRRNTSLKKFRMPKPQIEIAQAIAHSPAEARPLLARYLALYEG